MKFRFTYLILCFLLIFASCNEDDENLNGTGVVEFTIQELTEVENATNALGINIGVDSYNHAGGTIGVTISGGSYGDDYTTSTENASFNLDVDPGELLTSFTLIPVDDDIIEDNVILTITLTDVTGALQLGENTTLVFTILDNDDPLIALVSFENATAQVQENDASSTTINIPFDQATTDGGTITIQATGDAVYGTDYSISGQTSGDFTITVPSGATSASFDIQPIDNLVFETNKTVTFTITDFSGGLSQGTTTSNTVTIINDDLPTNPVIDFDAANILTYNEDAGTVTLNFVLSEATIADATIELTTSGDADASDFNFSGSNSPYSFVIPSGSTTGSVDITIVDDADTESNETIVIDITSVSGGLDAGLNLQQQTLTITDNDAVDFDYVETFETTSDLPSIGFESFALSTQDLPSNRIAKYNMNTGKYADLDDVMLDSDSGLVLFYKNDFDGNGIIDNVVITPEMQVTGNVDVSVDIAYSQTQEFNNAVVTFYYSETYNASGTWNASDWTSMGTETAQGLENEGISVGDYKRKVMSISPSSNFYVAVRVNQTIDDTFWKTQWRLDNFKVTN